MRQKLTTILLGILLLWPKLAGAQGNQGNPPTGQNFQQIGNTDVKVPSYFGGATGPAGKLNFGDVLLQIFNIALLIVGSIAVLFLIYGGFRYIFARGNEEDAENAKKTIFHALTGLAIVILSFAVVALVARLLITGQP